MWDYIKSLFLYSETIFLARMAVIGGFITTLSGSLDLSPLWSLFSTGTDFTWKQLTFMGLGILGAGITVEMARRRNSKLNS